MPSNRYQPIACSAYDVLEASAVRRTIVKLDTVGDGGIQTGEAFILDLFSRDTREFVKAKDATTSEEFIIRLDEITAITDVVTGKVYSTAAC